MPMLRSFLVSKSYGFIFGSLRSPHNAEDIVSHVAGHITIAYIPSSHASVLKLMPRFYILPSGFQIHILFEETNSEIVMV